MNFVPMYQFQNAPKEIAALVLITPRVRMDMSVIDRDVSMHVVRWLVVLNQFAKKAIVIVYRVIQEMRTIYSLDVFPTTNARLMSTAKIQKYVFKWLKM